jgi:hypothetical protein
MPSKKPIFSYRDIRKGKSYYGRRVVEIHSWGVNGDSPTDESDDIVWKRVRGKGADFGECTAQDFARYVRAQKRARRLAREGR